MPVSHPTYRGIATVVIPAALGGAVWEATGLPLGWLMGAAVVAGGFAAFDWQISLPGALYKPSLATIGASVGLAVTPAAAAEMVAWAPVMLGSALLGIACAAGFAPFLARLGHMAHSTAFFSLLPGGVVEMANVGDRHGADSTTIAALHAVRVALVVGVLPLALFLLLPTQNTGPISADPLGAGEIMLVMATGLLGGFLAARTGLPAAWLLGAVIAVGVTTSAGVVSGALPSAFLAMAQVIAGISLGARLTRRRLAAIPRALAVGTPVLLAIMAVMALSAAIASLVMPYPLATLILCFSIGGMAEMVLTARALDQDVALVAAFQALRGITVNALAASVWRRLPQTPEHSRKSKG